MKILISAYACRPNVGSEPGIGWNFAIHASQSHDVWVLTRPDNRPSIDQAIAADLSGRLAKIHFVYVPWTGMVARRIPRKFVRARYYFWQKEVRRVAGEMHRQLQFELAHHVTYGCYWQPAGVSGLDLPFVWGPVGGGEAAPGSFVSDLPPRGRVLEHIRTFARWIGEHSPSNRRTARRATVALATSRETAERLTKLGAPEVEIFTAMGLDAAEIASLAALPQLVCTDGSPIRFVSSGRLLDWKGFHLGLRAFAQATLPAGSRYDIIGNGPAAKSLQRLVDELKIGDRVHFAGQLSRDEAMKSLAASHVLVHPSLHDSGGWVCLEAMAMGKPVMCLDLGGPGLIVTNETGVKVAAQTPAAAVTALAQAMTRLGNSPDVLQRLGQAAQQRVEAVFSWTSRTKAIDALYRRTLGKADSGVVGLTNPTAVNISG